MSLVKTYAIVEGLTIMSRYVTTDSGCVLERGILYSPMFETDDVTEEDKQRLRLLGWTERVGDWILTDGKTQ